MQSYNPALLVTGVMIGVGLGASCGAAATEVQAPLAQARLTVHADRPIRVIPREIFGANLEWLYDGSGLWDREAGKHFEDRLREVQRLRFGSFRYPGGTLSDYFHWEETIGSNRKPQYNPFHIHDKNAEKERLPAYGAAEFLETCKLLSATPWITANAGTGTPEEAAAWAKWCKTDGGLEVMHWEVGNELYLPADDPAHVAFTPQQYVEAFRKFALALKAVNPWTQVAAIAMMPPAPGLVKETDWNEVVIRGCADLMDCVALHNAYAPVVVIGPDKKAMPDEDIYRAMLGNALVTRWSTEQVLALVRKHAGRRAEDIRIAITEHEGLFYPLPGEDAFVTVKRNRTLGTAIYLATLYNYFITEPKIRYAHKMTLITPIFGGVLNMRFGPNPEVWPNPHYFVCQEYARTSGETALRCEVGCESYAARAVGFVPELPGVPYLDAAASLADSGDLRVFLVNRDLWRTLPVEVTLRGHQPASARLTTLSGPKFDATNDNPSSLSVRPAEREIGITTLKRLDLPPCSLSVLRLCGGSP